MPLRFSRRFRLFPGARVNSSKRGASFSVGRRGSWLTLGHGRVRETIGLPGTGLGWYEQQRVVTHWHVSPWLLVGAVVAFLLFGRCGPVGPWSGRSGRRDLALRVYAWHASGHPGCPMTGRELVVECRVTNNHDSWRVSSTFRCRGQQTLVERPPPRHYNDGPCGQKRNSHQRPLDSLLSSSGVDFMLRAWSAADTPRDKEGVEGSSRALNSHRKNMTLL